MIRLLAPDDAEAYTALRREALLDSPLSFAASPGEDLASDAAAVRDRLLRGPEAVIFGAFTAVNGGAPELAGIAGLFRDGKLKSRHKAHVWGMYVAPAHRGRGLAAGLLAAAVEHARSLPGVAWVHLSVSSTAPGAQRLYERAGFRVWGREPDALRWGGASADELHLALQLE